MKKRGVVILSETDVSPHIIYIRYAEGPGIGTPGPRVTKVATSKEAHIRYAKKGGVGP
jgi:hypothetical protein